MVIGGGRPASDSGRKITYGYQCNEGYGGSRQKELLISENGCRKVLTVIPKRRGMQIGCTFVTYEAFDELHRIANVEES